MRQNIVRPMGIVAVSEEQTSCPTNPCRNLNGGCEDICGQVKRSQTRPAFEAEIF